MTSKIIGLLFMFIVLAGWLFPGPAEAQLGAGVVLWRHTTNLEAERATDFDGTDDTADARLKEWDTKGSGIGIRVDYHFPALASIHGAIGMAQVTVRDEDIGDPNLDRNSRGFDDGLYAAVGGTIGGAFTANPNVFWLAGVTLSVFSSDVKEDVSTTWEYSESSVAINGTAGYKLRGVGVYGGVRAVWLGADLDETNRANPVGQQTRSTELKRDGQIDLVIGARTGSQPVAGFVELGIIGTVSAMTGLSFQF